MCLSVQDQLLANLSLFTVLRIFRSFVNDFRTFEECVSLFSYQCSFESRPAVSSYLWSRFIFLSCDSLDILSSLLLSVKKFFPDFLLDFFKFLTCRTAFTIPCCRSNGEGGIWTLAPLLTTYSLSRGAPSTTWVLLQNAWMKSFFNGEGGIRTHAPLRTNGFQDRLVMTTSIPLHIMSWSSAPVSLRDNSYFSIIFRSCQHIFLLFCNFMLQFSLPMSREVSRCIRSVIPRFAGARLRFPQPVCMHL